MKTKKTNQIDKIWSHLNNLEIEDIKTE